MEKPFDRYVWQARVLPAFFVLLPLALAFAAWVGKPEDAVKPIAGIVVGTGVLAVLAQVSRDAGKKVEMRLIPLRGKRPSIAMLRHRDPIIDAVTKQRYHAKLSKAIADLRMPTKEEEALDPDAADAVYTSCVKYLVSKRRDQKAFSVLFSENVDYGFRRNLRGMKRVGVVSALIGLAAVGLRLYLGHQQGTGIAPLGLACAGIEVLILFVWFMSVNDDWVWSASTNYGLRLLDTIELLDAPGGKAKTEKGAAT